MDGTRAQYVAQNAVHRQDIMIMRLACQYAKKVMSILNYENGPSRTRMSFYFQAKAVLQKECERGLRRTYSVSNHNHLVQETIEIPLGIYFECSRAWSCRWQRTLAWNHNYWLFLIDFEGKEAFELYLISYQLILRKQIWWLVHEKGLPSELEVRRSCLICCLNSIINFCFLSWKITNPNYFSVFVSNSCWYLL